MDAFRDHADRGVKQSYKVPYLSERVVMNSHRLIDPLIERRLVGDIPEQLLQARSGKRGSGIHLTPSTVALALRSR